MDCQYASRQSPSPAKTPTPPTTRNTCGLSIRKPSIPISSQNSNTSYNQEHVWTVNTQAVNPLLQPKLKHLLQPGTRGDCQYASRQSPSPAKTPTPPTTRNTCGLSKRKPSIPFSSQNSNTSYNQEHVWTVNTQAVNPLLRPKLQHLLQPGTRGDCQYASRQSPSPAKTPTPPTTRNTWGLSIRKPSIPFSGQNSNTSYNQEHVGTVNTQAVNPLLQPKLQHLLQPGTRGDCQYASRQSPSPAKTPTPPTTRNTWGLSIRKPSIPFSSQNSNTSYNQEHVGTVNTQAVNPLLQPKLKHLLQPGTRGDCQYASRQSPSPAKTPTPPTSVFRLNGNLQTVENGGRRWRWG